MTSVYILYSNFINKYYVGSCKEMSERVDQHLSKYFKGGFTSKTKDWVVYFCLENLSYTQARKIEQHIKKMKSRVYIENLVKYPELSSKLLSLFPA